jgi:dihydroorotate dehydrogenase (NAD+) catalytic subunit
VVVFRYGWGDKMATENNADLSVKLGQLELANPVIAASGTFGYGLEFLPFVDLDRLGGFSTKGLSLKPRMGNPVPRMVETASGMLNAIGLENIGLDKFLSEKLPLLEKYKTRILVNFFGDTKDEYIEMATRLSDVERVDALEMNISCPNVEEGGVQFSSDPAVVRSLVTAVRQATKKFLIVKLSPNVTDITEIAKAAEEGGADAISLINTAIGMSIDLETRKPYLANKTGGLSGPAIKPIALNMVYQTVRSVKIPVIGMGGISNAEDALEFLSAGATAIQIGTANFIDPGITMKVIEGIRNYCQKHAIQKVGDLKLKED